MKRFGTTVVVAAGLALMSAGFVLAAGSGVDSAYWGRIVASMVLMAAGLAFTTGPATEAIMGALPAGRVGAGSAVNDTTREIGGTLGVAIVGSVMNSIYGVAAGRRAERHFTVAGAGHGGEPVGHWRVRGSGAGPAGGGGQSWSARRRRPSSTG